MVYLQAEISRHHEEHREVWSVRGVVRTFHERKTYIQRISDHQSGPGAFLVWKCRDDGEAIHISNSEVAFHELVIVDVRPNGEEKVFPQGGHYERSSIISTSCQYSVRSLLRDLGSCRFALVDNIPHRRCFLGGAFAAAGPGVCARDQPS